MRWRHGLHTAEHADGHAGRRTKAGYSNSAILILKLPLTVVSMIFAAVLVALSALSVTHSDVNNVFRDVMERNSAASILYLSS